jgi:hypothetical protein
MAALGALHEAPTRTVDLQHRLLNDAFGLRAVTCLARRNP